MTSFNVEAGDILVIADSIQACTSHTGIRLVRENTQREVQGQGHSQSPGSLLITTLRWTFL